MRFGEAAGNRKSKAGPPSIRGRTNRSIEGLENPIPLLERDSRAPIRYAEHEESILETDRQQHIGAGCRMAGGVLDQVVQNAEREDEIELAHQRLLIPIDVGLERNARGPDELSRDGSDQILGGIELGIDRDGAGFDPTPVEEVTDQPSQKVRLLFDGGRIGLSLLGPALRQRFDRREWRPEVVRQGREQHVSHAIRPAKHLGVLGFGHEVDPFDRERGVVRQHGEESSLGLLEAERDDIGQPKHPDGAAVAEERNEDPVHAVVVHGDRDQMVGSLARGGVRVR